MSAPGEKPQISEDLLSDSQELGILIDSKYGGQSQETLQILHYLFKGLYLKLQRVANTEKDLPPHILHSINSVIQTTRQNGSFGPGTASDDVTCQSTLEELEKLKGDLLGESFSKKTSKALGDLFKGLHIRLQRTVGRDLYPSDLLTAVGELADKCYTGENPTTEVATARDTLGKIFEGRR